MTFIELEELAYTNRQVPNGLNVLEQAVFLAFRCLYSHYRSGKIGRDDATREKKAIRLAHEKRVELNAFGEKCLQHNISIRKTVEGLVNQYRKNPTLDIADKIVRALDGQYLE